MAITILKVNGIEYEVEVATEYWKRAKGLMGKTEGRMLFIFQKEDQHLFSMDFMKVPIDFIFISKEKEIIEIRENVQPSTWNPMSWRRVMPKKKSLYVLEAEAGFIKENKIHIGQLIEIGKGKI